MTELVLPKIDKTIINKKNGYMGRMSLDLFKKIVDQAEGNVEFITLASRGEPLACAEIIPMLNYTRGKFLNLKLNLLSSVQAFLNQVGRLVCIKRTFVTRFFAVSCLVATTRIFLSE